MKIYMSPTHFREDDRITITYANGEQLGYSVTLHALKKMILKGGDRTYNCEYHEHTWDNSKYGFVPRFVLVGRQRILEIKSADGEIVYRAKDKQDE